MNPMTNLEQALGRILESIATSGAADTVMLAALVERKDAICAALAAPEHSWHVAKAQASHDVRRQSESAEEVLTLSAA
jgi:hypothetical protein